MELRMNFTDQYSFLIVISSKNNIFAKMYYIMTKSQNNQSWSVTQFLRLD